MNPANNYQSNFVISLKLNGKLKIQNVKVFSILRFQFCIKTV